MSIVLILFGESVYVCNTMQNVNSNFLFFSLLFLTLCVTDIKDHFFLVFVSCHFI